MNQALKTHSYFNIFSYFKQNLIYLISIIGLVILGFLSISHAEANVGQLPLPGIPVLTLSNSASGGQTYTLSLQILLLMTILTLLPSALLMMTCFTRILIVFSILRQAIGLQQTPSNQIILGLTLFLTLFIMSPVFEKVHENALVPYLDQKIDHTQAMNEAIEPFHAFMRSQTRESDLQLFMELGRKPAFKDPASIPLTILIPSFITSELKTAFQLGFYLFIPFLIIDLVVASVLMAMGMMMLSPLIVSLPFKIMLFVYLDGWSLIVRTLASSFGV